MIIKSLYYSIRSIVCSERFQISLPLYQMEKQPFLRKILLSTRVYRQIQMVNFKHICTTVEQNKLEGTLCSVKLNAAVYATMSTIKKKGKKIQPFYPWQVHMNITCAEKLYSNNYPIHVRSWNKQLGRLQSNSNIK